MDEKERTFLVAYAILCRQFGMVVASDHYNFDDPVLKTADAETVQSHLALLGVPEYTA